MTKLGLAVKAITKVGPGLKKWVFSDGTFNKARAGVLLVAGVLIGVGFYYVPEHMPAILDAIDTFSDSIGYADGQ